MLTRYVNYVKLILVAFVTSTLKNKQYIYEPKKVVREVQPSITK